MRHVEMVPVRAERTKRGLSIHGDEPYEPQLCHHTEDLESLATLTLINVPAAQCIIELYT